MSQEKFYEDIKLLQKRIEEDRLFKIYKQEMEKVMKQRSKKMIDNLKQ
jgi:hypothetical protein